MSKNITISDVPVAPNALTTQNISLQLTHDCQDRRDIVIKAYRHPMVDGQTSAYRSNNNKQPVLAGEIEAQSSKIEPQTPNNINPILSDGEITRLLQEIQHKNNVPNTDNPFKRTLTREEINQMPK